jgi:hypothetical protein
MEVTAAQRDVRLMYLGGFPGQLVCGLIWLASAALATWRSPSLGIWSLIIGCMFIFPLAQLVLKLMGRPASLPKGHPMIGLAMQIAFTVPLSLPLVAAATHAHWGWFYPSVMIIVGAHYLPFIHLYGMRMFGALAALLLGGALVFAHLEAAPFAAGGWFTGATLVAFAFLGLALVRREALSDRAT